jgi:hypothetical protein
MESFGQLFNRLRRGFSHHAAGVLKSCPKGATHHSSIPTFHHSRCERSEPGFLKKQVAEKNLIVYNYELGVLNA